MLSRYSTEIVVSIISIAGTLVVTVIAIFLRDFVLTIFTEKRESSRNKLETFKIYANPIIRAADSLCWRLREIFLQRGAFLLESNGRSEFFQYKYVSTVYRLTVLLGWVRAIQREYAYMDIENLNEGPTIERTLARFQSALADGGHVELSVFKELVKLWGIDTKDVSDRDKALLAVKIEDQIHSTVPNVTFQLSESLSEDQQMYLLENIAKLLSTSLKRTPVPRDVICENKAKAIQEMSRIEAWVFRDWQNAIGDEILVELVGATRRFDVLGFGKFEELFVSPPTWLTRVNRVFENLNVEVDDRFDARVNQLKNIYHAAFVILESFVKLNNEQMTISKESLQTLRTFDEELNAV